MIRNLTPAEASALLEAITLQDTAWEQDGDNYGRDATRQRQALRRAQMKVRQIAPSGTI